MFKTFAKSLLAFTACLYLSGSHLAFLQLVAWSGMLVSYSAESGLAEGMRDTFSGEKPCSMCKAIATVRSQETSGEESVPALPRVTDKLWTEMLPAAEWFRVGWVPLDRLEIGFAPVAGGMDAGKARPPVPPPRTVV